MAVTCPKCRAELPRQLLWKALKSGTLDKAEITCPQCHQVLRITPKSLVTILALALLPSVPIVLWIIFFLTPPRLNEITILVLVVLMPLMNIALLIVLYPRLVRFREKPPSYSIRG